MTLDRVLSRFGILSRTDGRKAIAQGRIKVNGRVLRDPESWVQPGRDVLHLDGRRLRPARKTYLAFYKPRGVVTSYGDPGGRPTIYEYLDRKHGWVAPVGRLDMESSGLLLLSNDTDFAHFVTDPASRVEKTYRVKLNARIDDGLLARLAAGIRMERGDWARPVRVRRLEDKGAYSRIEVVLTEGKNREVRRMMEALGFHVLKLVRTGIGRLTLEGLQVGEARELSRAEVASITAGFRGRGSTRVSTGS